MKHIIHFTSKFNNLESILKSKALQLHYCKEDFWLGDKVISKAAHPMISFSEYETSTIDNNTITYGHFGIAFTNGWIKKNKIHPVLYVDRNSLVAKSLADLLVARRKNAKTQLSPNVRLSIMTIKCFTKNTIGFNSYLRKENYEFKNENEWRYVPTKRQINNKLISQDKSKYMARQNFYNEQLKPYSLPFLNSDIEIIFVQTKEQVAILKQIGITVNKIKISRWSTTLFPEH